MTENPQFTEMRLRALQEWCQTVALPGLERDDFLAIFQYVLAQQKPSGEWTVDDTLWEVVMTSVVLKALAAARFRATDAWELDYEKDRKTGSVESALSYLRGPLRDKSTAEVGEDIWDTCQALLAVAAFGRHEAGLRHARKIASDWNKFYNEACDTDVRWCGPAYLAAMIDVLLQYAPHLDMDVDVKQVLSRLAALEAVQGDTPSGSFRACKQDTNMDRWNTSLVLRTLCSAPEVDFALVERSATWMLDQLPGPGWEADRAEAPMFYARCLDGLCRARRFVSPKIAGRIDAAVVRYNKKLISYWNAVPKLRVGKLKAYTAVVEYLSALAVPAPAGLILDCPAAPATTVRLSPEATERRGVFIVHGHDKDTVDELTLYLQNTLKLGKPTVLGDERSGGATIIEKFEREAERAGLVFVLVTPDDVGGLADEAPKVLKRRARQNVIFEMGYFVGKLGRTSGRVLLLWKGEKIEWPSDLGGVIPIHISDRVEDVGEKIRREIDPFLEELRAARNP